jgi:hypothetical protein
MKMNKMYEAPKAEVVELNVMNAVMESGIGDISMDTHGVNEF